MDADFKGFAEAVALGCEFVAVVFIAIAAAEAAVRSVLQLRRMGDLSAKKAIWLRFAASIVMALEFALAADIARTVIAPSWTEVGQLAAIAVIRTFLNYFLARDIESFDKPSGASSGPSSS